MRRFIVILFCLFIQTALCGEIIDKIVATVNGEPVTLSELERILQPVYRRYEQAYKGPVLEEAKRRARTELLEQLIENKLILQKAKKDGVSVKEAAVEEELANVKSKFGSVKSFEDALAKEGMTVSRYKKELTDQLTIRAMIEKEIAPNARVSPEDIRAYYNGHKDEFVRPETVRIGHILIKKDENKIKDIYAHLEAGADFDGLAEKYSEAGNMGYIPVNKLKPELKKIIESLKIGQYSKIIKTDMGWHIIRLEDKKPSETLSLSSVWDDLENKLFRQRLAQEHKKWISLLKDKAHIMISE